MIDMSTFQRYDDRQPDSKVDPKEVYDYLISKGVPDAHAKGMLSNIQAESGFDPSIHEKGVDEDKGGIGLFQHTGPRRKALQNDVPDWKTNWKGQLDYALSEPQTKDYLSTNFKTPQEASRSFTTDWESPANSDNKALKRQGNFALLDLPKDSATDATTGKLPKIDMSTFQPYGGSSKGSNIDMSTFKPIDNGQSSDNDSFLEKAGKGALGYATGALRQLPGSDVAAAGVSTLVTNPLIDLFKEGKVTDMSPPALLKAFKENYAADQAAGNKLEKQSPIAATLGHVGTAIPEYALGGKLLGMGKDASILSNIVKGAGLSTAIGQGDRGAKIDPTASSIDALLGAAGEGLAAPLSKAAGYIAEKAAPIAQKVYRGMESTPWLGKYLSLERDAAQKGINEAANIADAAKKSQYQSGVADLNHQFDTQEAVREAAHSNNATDLSQQFDTQEAQRQAEHDAELKSAQENVSNIPSSNKIQAGTNLGNAAEEAKTTLGKQYSELVDPILQEHGNTKISAQNLRDSINGSLAKEGLLDAKGNILRDEIESYSSPTLKNLYGKLADISESLKTNPTVFGLQRELDSLSELSNFDKQLPQKQQALFRQLRSAAKTDLHEGISNLAGPEAKASLEQAKQTYSQNKPVINDILSTTRGVEPEKVVEKAGANLRGSTLEDIVTKQPQLKAPLSDVVLNNIVEKGTTATKLTQAIDGYGRDTLQKLLPPDKYAQLMDAEQKLIKTSALFQKGTKPSILPFQKGTRPSKIPFKPSAGPQWLPNKTNAVVKATGKALGRGSGLIRGVIPIGTVLNNKYNQ